jgi:hypothetical protein
MDTVDSKLSIKWIEDTIIAGMDSNLKPIVIGSSKKGELLWQGMKASDLLLLSAASCSTSDRVFRSKALFCNWYS